jgi:hypothetical protein
MYGEAHKLTFALGGKEFDSDTRLEDTLDTEPTETKVTLAARRVRETRHKLRRRERPQRELDEFGGTIQSAVRQRTTP